jgi:hypothetical protein
MGKRSLDSVGPNVALTLLQAFLDLTKSGDYTQNLGQRAECWQKATRASHLGSYSESIPERVTRAWPFLDVRSSDGTKLSL